MKNEDLIWKSLETGYALDTRWLKVRKEKVELPNGKVLDDFYTIEGGDLIAILAIDDVENVFLVKQYRHAVSDVTVDLPGGGVEKGESSVDAAIREFAEETGMIAASMEKLVTYYPDSGRTACTKHIFLAKDLSKDTSGRYTQDESEDIRLMKMPLQEVLEGMRNGEMKDATLFVAIGAYLNRK